MRLFDYTPEGALVRDETGEYYLNGIDSVEAFFSDPNYSYHGYKRINGVVWHIFWYEGE